jgi:antitoxin component YwqK of YwqJK toxin-antitoxin module
LLYGEGEFIDGKREDNWKFYLLEDKTFKKILQQVGSFIKGEQVGLFKYFFPSGNIAVEGKYVSNKLDGEIKSYYEDGKLHGTRFFRNGLKQAGILIFIQTGS